MVLLQLLKKVKASERNTYVVYGAAKIRSVE